MKRETITESAVISELRGMTFVTDICEVGIMMLIDKPEIEC